MASQWQTVSSRSAKSQSQTSKLKKVDARALSENEVQTFLSSFKIKPCQETNKHEPRACLYYHNTNDTRRDPYSSCYDIDECQNSIETMYHPVTFRTTLCKRKDKCPFVSTCSYAHTQKDLRDRSTSSQNYEEFSMHQQRAQQQTQGVELNDFFLPTEKRSFKEKTHELITIWREHHIETQEVSYLLEPYQGFLSRNYGILEALRDIAFEDGLALISLRHISHKQTKLVAKGPHAKQTLSQCLRFLQSPSEYFVQEIHDLGARVVKTLETEIATTPGIFLGSSVSNIFVDIISETEVRFTAISKPNCSGSKIVRDVMSEIKYWMSKEEYDKFIACCIGYDAWNPDEGVQCKNGHFLCSNGCFDRGVQSQLVHIQTRKKDHVICPLCGDPYHMQTLASNLSPETWEKVRRAIVDKEVETQREELQNEFNSQLKTEVEKVMAKYGQANELLKMEAKREAHQIRNTVMNLACPHCSTAYFEFTGCMALECATCKKSFCGYCHQPTATSRGAHEHVRACLMNTTPDGKLLCR